MKHKISILDILQVDGKILKEKESNMACYTGIITENIPKKTLFKYLYDKSNPRTLIEGDFTIKYIEILSKPSEELVSGYNALVFIKSNIDIETMKNLINLDEKDNITSIYELSTIKPFV
ncbi:hypothetical protein [Aquimarina aggregata]|uniref:hypothetical protein n=1 Tax=Aquimarina aggregata TaxID=1642818 RepID=UPI0024935018|nr:hypothetical protein [Aquimarina aggregata]